MTWNLITVAFGDKKYKQGQRFLTKQASECNVNHIEYSDEDLFKSELYKEYPEWMSAENNYGWFTWKPYFILQAMENLKEGDKVLLLDTLDIFHPDIFDFVDEGMGDEGKIEKRSLAARAFGKKERQLAGTPQNYR